MDIAQAVHGVAMKSLNPICTCNQIGGHAHGCRARIIGGFIDADKAHEAASKGIVPDVTHDWEGRCRELEEENSKLRQENALLKAGAKPEPETGTFTTT